MSAPLSWLGLVHVSSVLLLLLHAVMRLPVGHEDHTRQLGTPLFGPD